MVIWDVFLDISDPNMLVYEIFTYNISFIQNEHVKFDEKRQDTQGNYKANLSKVMEILGQLTSKFHET